MSAADVSLTKCVCSRHKSVALGVFALEKKRFELCSGLLVSKFCLNLLLTFSYSLGYPQDGGSR